MRLPPPVLLVLALAVQRAMTREATAPTPSRRGAAGALAAASLATAGAAAQRFRHSGTTVDPFHPDRSSALVTTGVNAATRNPMYVGMAGLLVAHAAYRGSWSALAPAAAFMAVIDVHQMRFEEDALRKQFGGDYEAYCSTVPRWVDLRSLRALGGRF